MSGSIGSSAMGGSAGISYQNVYQINITDSFSTTSISYDQSDIEMYVNADWINSDKLNGKVTTNAPAQPSTTLSWLFGSSSTVLVSEQSGTVTGSCSLEETANGIYKPTLELKAEGQK